MYPKNPFPRMFRSLVVLPALLLLFFTSACVKEIPRTLFDPKPDPIEVFEIKDIYKGEQRSYSMIVRRVGNHYVFSNFAGLKIDVNALIEAEQISIFHQSFSAGDADSRDIEIFEGTGFLTADALTLNFSARDGADAFTHSITAERSK